MLIIGFIIGFFIVEILSGKREGKIGLFILFLKTKHHTYHLHHWLVALILFALLTILEITNDFVSGILIGVFIQGLTYKDFHKVIVKQKRKKKK